jgi:hypothetical protein
MFKHQICLFLKGGDLGSPKELSHYEIFGAVTFFLEKKEKYMQV